MHIVRVKSGGVCDGFFFFQAEDGIRDLVRSRGLGDVYKRQTIVVLAPHVRRQQIIERGDRPPPGNLARGLEPLRVLIEHGIDDVNERFITCLLYTSDAADDLLCVDLGGRRIIKKKKTKSKENESRYNKQTTTQYYNTTQQQYDVTYYSNCINYHVQAN